MKAVGRGSRRAESHGSAGASPSRSAKTYNHTTPLVLRSGPLANPVGAGMILGPGESGPRRSLAEGAARRRRYRGGGYLAYDGGLAIAIDTGLRTYLKQINKAPLLSAEDERQLAERIQYAQQLARKFAAGECSLECKERAEEEATRAREGMVRANLRLVVNIAKRYTKSGMSLGDLIEEGNLGLIRAVEGFDPAQGTRFSTYASWWIKQAIKRSLINGVQPIHIPAYMVEMIAKWRHARDDFLEKEGRNPSICELAEFMKLPERKVRIIRRAVKAFSSPTQSTDMDTGFSLSELLADQRTPQPEAAMFSEAESTMLKCLLDQIDEREATILRMRFGIENGEAMTLKDIGKRIGLTRERVRQIESEALRKLNELIHAHE
jgi:RNA polymerase primary sigma factor